jgi:hypothetical protein
MKECVWVRPQLVAEIEFLEWTGADHLRHPKFLGLRDDEDPRKVVRETSVSIGASRYSLSCRGTGTTIQACDNGQQRLEAV